MNIFYTKLWKHVKCWFTVNKGKSFNKNRTHLLGKAVDFDIKCQTKENHPNWGEGSKKGFNKQFKQYGNN